jgi:hypothetical protein
LRLRAGMLTSPPQQGVHYLIARFPAAGEFRELFDCSMYNYNINVNTGSL